MIIGFARADVVVDSNYFLFELYEFRLEYKEAAHPLLFAEFHRHHSMSKDPQNASLDLVRV